jgi:endoglucanase
MPSCTITRASASHDFGYRSEQRARYLERNFLLARPRHRRATAWLCLALALSLAVIGAIAWWVAQPQPTLTLRVIENKLVNEKGSSIRLLGIDRSGTEYACIYGRLTDGPTDNQSITVMTSWRINAVRIPLNEDCWLGINGLPVRYSRARYRAAIRAYVARLHQAGLYVILDLHWSAPGRVRATRQQPMADLDHSVAFWSSVARVFKADPAVAFDLYNEPHGMNWTCWRDGCVLPEGWRTAGMQALVDAVRSTGAHQPIIAAGLASGNDLSAWLQYRPQDPAHQLAAGLHMYNFLSCVTVGCWTKVIGPVVRSVPVITTELGEADCSDAFIDMFMKWADSAGVSYLGWSWNPTGCRAPALIRSWKGSLRRTVRDCART